MSTEASEGLIEALAKALWEFDGYDSRPADDSITGGYLARAEVLATIVAAREAKARADERRAAWDWFGEMLKAHQYEGQPIWDEYVSDRRSLGIARGDA